MRLLLALLLAALIPRPAVAEGIVVDLVNRRVETSRLILRFDTACPEALRQVTYKDWHPSQDLTDDSGLNEFWGQSARGISGTSYIRPFEILVGDWFVIAQSDTQVVIGIQSVTDYEPSVETVYTIPADQPWYEVKRTVFFGEMPESTSYQAYLPRVAFSTTSRAVRFRDLQGQVLQRSYCFSGCEQTDWDGRWIQHVGWTGVNQLSVAVIGSQYHAHGPTFVRGRGPISGSDWNSPLLPSIFRNAAETSRSLIAFGRDVDDTTRLDSLWTWYHTRYMVLDAPVVSVPRVEARLQAAPNPARATTSLRFALPREAAVSLRVHDLAGRLVATVHEGVLAGGSHSLQWDGHSDGGLTAPPGLYLARLVTPRGVSTARVMRVR